MSGPYVGSATVSTTPWSSAHRVAAARLVTASLM